MGRTRIRFERKNEIMTKIKKRKIKIALAIGFVFVFALLMLLLFSGSNADLIRSIFTDDLSQDEIQDKLREFGIRGYITITLLSMLQIVLTFLPAEPVQVIAGVTFGFLRGLAACMVGVILGNTVIYILYKVYGARMNVYFDKHLDVDMERVSRSGSVALVVFILYFLPAIPYGMICFLAASMRMKYPRFIMVTTLGSIPSVCIGVGLGQMAIASNWIVSVAVLGVIAVLVIIVMVKRDFIMSKINAFIHRVTEPHSSKTKVEKNAPFLLAIISFFAGLFLRIKGVRYKLTNNVEKIEHPAIVLCNHGSFIDFVYAGKLLRRDHPNFIVARLYFYHKRLGKLMRKLGCFPKSMFTLDVSSAKNCRRVLRSNGVLAMMPEARLSTVGRFEDIQPSTFSFLKQARVPVYTINIHGDYFADPKWGKGFRRGSLVEAELNPLLTKEDIEALSVEEIGNRVEERLRYDEFEWLKTRPEIRYTDRRIAEGLENILAICPSCGGMHTIKTEGNRVYCESCSLETTVDSRYAFTGGVRFNNFAEWYDWQCERFAEMAEDEDFSLTSKVTLKHQSYSGKEMLREAGEGVCTLNREGLTYVGTRDGEMIEKHFSMDEIYRLLFGAGVNFEIYEAKVIWFFVPEELRSAVDWYIVSRILKDKTSVVETN